MITCKECGSPLGDARFCPNCGTKNEPELSSEASASQRPHFCPECGHSLGNENFCPHCGRKIENMPASTAEISQSISTEQQTHSDQITGKNVACPHCGSKNLQYFVEQNVHTQGKDYSLGKGCLGYILMGGPLGLLCGLCGQKKTVVSTNKHQWICKDCGTKFLEAEERQKAVKQQVVQLILTGVTGFLMGAGLRFIRYAPAFLKIRELGQLMNVVIIAVEIVFVLALISDVIKLIQVLKKPAVR